jgi:hypothetical protein
VSDAELTADRSGQLSTSGQRWVLVILCVTQIVSRRVTAGGGIRDRGWRRLDPIEISDEMTRAQAEFRELINKATPQELRRRSDGTRWTNRQLLFHMVFGYLIVRTLLPLVHVLGRLGLSRGFAATLNASRRPFHVINYLGSCGGVNRPGSDGGPVYGIATLMWSSRWAA